MPDVTAMIIPATGAWSAGSDETQSEIFQPQKQHAVMGIAMEITNSSSVCSFAPQLAVLAAVQWPVPRKTSTKQECEWARLQRGRRQEPESCILVVAQHGENRDAVMAATEPTQRRAVWALEVEVSAHVRSRSIVVDATMKRTEKAFDQVHTTRSLRVPQVCQLFG